eukprot:Blabericola_migrator_1__256@NODE_1068_length_5539_cov_59_002376_g356_i1_p7_GENE_NODE_1068_length_5539_cov_59_002376_g356_i1NODE_1068_length_5539_cov_59_002376_g356_i1_p7_ORF_typecomplete_len101_score15_14_NODE_1068_length_5539_cov_59_002376_g356_i149115213
MSVCASGLSVTLSTEPWGSLALPAASDGGTRRFSEAGQTTGWIDVGGKVGGTVSVVWLTSVPKMSVCASGWSVTTSTEPWRSLALPAASDGGTKGLSKGG